MLNLASRARLTAGLFVLAAITGCATPGERARIGADPESARVAIVAATRIPDFRFEGFAHGKGEGAARGAASAFGACASGLGHGGCSGAMCGAALVFLLGICGMAGLIGATAGATLAPPAEAMQAAEAALTRALEVRAIQQTLRDSVESAALAGGVLLVRVSPEARAAAERGDFRLLRAAGVDTVLETDLREAGTEGSGINAPVLAYMKARVRLVRAADGTELRVADFTHLGKSLSLADWSAKQGAALLDQVALGYEALGRQVYESVFELYPFPDQSAHSAGGILSTAFGLAPLTPPTRGQLSRDTLIGPRFEWTAVESLRPVLRWQAFPRATDQAAAPQDMQRVSNVRYDLVIAREENLAAAEVVYRRQNLPRPEHALEVSLRRDTRYFWSVRARFELDGRQRVTEWGSTRSGAGEHLTAPSKFSFRFRTP